MENFDALIIDRLGEHQRKLDFIQENLRTERRRRPSFRKVGYAIMAAAACLAIIFVVSPMLFKSDSLSELSISVPSLSEYRGSQGSDQLIMLMENGNYTQALSAVNSALTENDREIRALSDSGMNGAEQEYMMELYNAEREELLWSRIYILVKLERVDDLKANCLYYLNDKSLREHKAEVETILSKIR